MDAKELKVYLSEDADRVIKVLEYFDFHGFQTHHKTDEVRVSCALPDGDNTTSVNIYLNEYLNGIVFTRGNFKGDIFSIIEEFTGYEFKSIINNIQAILGISGSSEKHIDYSKQILDIGNFKYYYNRKKRQKEGVSNNVLHEPSKALMGYIPHPVADIVEEGISPKVCRQFGIHTDMNRGRILFPHYDWIEHDQIVGIQGRIIGMDDYTAKQLKIPKYWNYIDGYKKEYNLYGWSHNHKNINDNKMMIIFEGEKSVLKEATLTRGEGVSVAVGGHYLSDEHIKFIGKNTSLDTEVVIAFDNDIIKNKEKFEMLYQNIKPLLDIRKVTYIEDVFGKFLDEKDSPIDKKPSVWRALLSIRRKFEL